MDEALSRRRRRVRMYLHVMVLCCAAPVVCAETLADPTRPALPSASSLPAEGVTEPQVGVGMVVTAKEGVMALIDGRILRVGSRTEAGVVTRIAPNAVFVRSTDGKMTRLPLYPAVSVQQVVRPEAATTRPAGKADKPNKRANVPGAIQDRSAR